MYTEEEVKVSPIYSQMYYTRSRMRPATRKNTRNKESRLIWQFPFAAEREYDRWIHSELVTNVVRPVNKYVLQNYLDWLQDAKIDSVEHTDGVLDIIKGIANVTRKAFSVVTKVFKVGGDVNIKNQGQWNKFVKESSGVNLQLFDPAAERYVQEWADLNNEFLSNLPIEYANRVSQIVSDGVANNESKKSIGEKLYEAGKSYLGTTSRAQRRAARIARDQVGKLNSTLSRSRMAQAQIGVYKWSTSGDERVRGTPGGKYPKSRYSHYLMDGKYKQVDNANKVSSNGEDWHNVRGREEPRHAGQAINCRCVMIPSFIQMKNIVDKEIDQNVR